MKEIARKLRKQGVTLRRIAEICHVSTWTIQQWCRDIAPQLAERVCERAGCGKPFHPTRADARFCSSGCQQRNRVEKRTGVKANG